MFRKNYFTFLLSIALLLAASIAAFAQTAPLSGRVELKTADGKTEPVAGALVELFGTDQKAKLPTDKTDKKGYFSFAGVALGQKYIIVVSKEGISPGVASDIPAGTDKIVISVTPGDGKRWTEEEVKAALKGQAAQTTGGTTEISADEKKAEAERLKKLEELKAKNANIENKNAVKQAALKEGNDAIDAKNFDLAIAKFEEGYQADTAFIGSAPVFLTGKAKVLSSRAVDKFNKGVKLTDATAKMEAMNGVTKDFSESIDAFNTSWTMLKNAPAASIPDAKNYETNKMEVLTGLQTTMGYMIAAEKVDISKVGIVKDLTTEYINIENDAAKKAKAQISLADIYRIAGDSDNAIVEYRKALEMSPDNVDALAGLGLSLFNSGEIANNTAQKQEGLNYMQKFIDVAPANHKYKADIVGLIDYLKNQKLTPQKVTNTKKKQ